MKYTAQLLTVQSVGVSLVKTKCRKKVSCMVKKVVLSCDKCGSRNYSIPSNKAVNERLELKKFCSHCNEHTLHKQTV